METNRHTHGPWAYASGAVCQTDGAGTIAKRGSDNRIPPVQKDANMRLIAAAPELLEALRMAVRVIRDNELDESMAGEFEILTDAITKATGELS